MTALKWIGVYCLYLVALAFFAAPRAEAKETVYLVVYTWYGETVPLKKVDTPTLGQTACEEQLAELDAKYEADAKEDPSFGYILACEPREVRE